MHNRPTNNERKKTQHDTQQSAEKKDTHINLTTHSRIRCLPKNEIRSVTSIICKIRTNAHTHTLVCSLVRTHSYLVSYNTNHDRSHTKQHIYLQSVWYLWEWLFLWTKFTKREGKTHKRNFEIGFYYIRFFGFVWFRLVSKLNVLRLKMLCMLQSSNYDYENWKTANFKFKCRMLWPIDSQIIKWFCRNRALWTDRQCIFYRNALNN